MRQLHLVGLGVVSLGIIAAVAASCSANPEPPAVGGEAAQGSGGGTAGGGTGGDAGSTFVSGGTGGSSGCDAHCSSDLHSLVDCNGNVLMTRPPDQGCSSSGCVPACDSAKENKSTIGCDY